MHGEIFYTGRRVIQKRFAAVDTKFGCNNPKIHVIYKHFGGGLNRRYSQAKPSNISELRCDCGTSQRSHNRIKRVHVVPENTISNRKGIFWTAVRSSSLDVQLSNRKGLGG